MNKEDLEILYNTMASKDRPPDYAVRLLEETCARTGLDWKMRHVYLMNRGGKWMVTLSIDGFRLIGSQDNEYSGQEGPFWVATSDGTWTDIPPDGPIYASKVGIKHRNGTVTWGVAKFKDYSAGPMWSKFPSTMIAKCAEMLAWRKAMPGRLGGLYGIEEMEQAERKPKRKMDSVGGSGSLGDSEPAVLPDNNFKTRIECASSAAELKGIGSDIMKSGLAEEEVIILHELYNKRKAQLNV